MWSLLLIIVSFHSWQAYGLDTSQWSARERQMKECLTVRGWSDEEIHKYHSRVLDRRHRTGVVSREDQDLVAGCITTGDFISYGIKPEGHTTTPASIPVYDKRMLERNVMVCLRNRGLGESLISAWYNRVLNPTSRVGYMSIRDRQLASSCLSPRQYNRLIMSPAYKPRSPVTTTASSIIASSAREQKIFECLLEQGWSEQRVKVWYDRVLNPLTNRGRATLFDQDMARGCVHTEDYFYYGVMPDGYHTSKTTSDNIIVQ